MNQDDIIKKALEVGAYPAANTDGALLFWSESQVERFFQAAYAAGAVAEREACAKTVEKIDTYEKIEKDCFKFAAKKIRARGNT